MKLLLFADPHWCTYSSIVRSRGNKFSKRLENLIETMNWIEELAWQHECSKIICLGDFFDSPQITSEEITALQEVNWRSIHHTFLVGNHDLGRSSAEFSSSHIFNISEDFQVVDKPMYFDCGDGTALFFLPYILENNRQPIKAYFDFDRLKRENNILFMHNDIKGMQMGKFISKDGFEIEDIESHFNLCVNGHIHNCGQVGNRIINLGNITGQNFSENAFEYGHFAMIIDTETRSVDYILNPVALNFYKLDVIGNDENTIIQKLNYFKLKNSVITIKCSNDQLNFIKDILEKSNNIIEYRTIVELDHNSDDSNVEQSSSFSMNHLEKFKEYVMDNIGTSKEVINELTKIIGVSNED